MSITYELRATGVEYVAEEEFYTSEQLTDIVKPIPARARGVQRMS